MKALEENLLKIPTYQELRVNQVFPSKKNIVALVSNKDNQYILKWYQSCTTRALKQEIYILQTAKNTLAVPNIISYDLNNNVVCMDYLTGTNLCDIINDETVSIHTKKEHIKSLAEWFSTFHQFFNNNQTYLIHGDAILRNFITSNKTLYGLDFEETKQGKPIEDISFLCASILTTHPKNTDEKKELSDVFIETYETMMNVQYTNMQTFINNAMKQMELRRHIQKKVNKK